MVDAEEFKKYIAEWADLLNQPIPKIKRLGVDIEVEAEIGKNTGSKDCRKKSHGHRSEGF